MTGRSATREHTGRPQGTVVGSGHTVAPARRGGGIGRVTLSRPTDASCHQTCATSGTSRGSHSSGSDSAPVDVQVVTPTRRDPVYTVKLPANVSPLYQTTLYAKVSGYLKWIGPDKGDAVKKNEVVAVIDAPEVEEQYQQAVSDYKD